MKKLKMNLKLVLALGIVLIVMSLFNMSNVKATDEEGFTYQIDSSTKEISISCNDKSITEFTIPSTYKGYKITRINSFANCKNLKNIKIPEGIKSIESYAFEDCTSLNNVVLPNSITSLGSYAFKGCTSLEKIQLSSKLDYLSDGCFAYCTNLKNITIPENVTTIGYCAFEHCTNLGKLEIPLTVTSINPFAFYPNPEDSNLILYVFRGSEAEMYAINYGINYKLSKYKLDSKSTQIKIGNEKYTGKEVKPKPTVKYRKTTLIFGTDYIVSYKNNTNLGTATVTIKGKGDYEGTVTKTFKIVVGQTKGLVTKLKDTKSITIKWNKDKVVSGYEVYMSTNKSKGYKKVATIRKNSTTSYKKTKLSGGKIYYFRVRAYKTRNNSKIYGEYSSILTTNTKMLIPTLSKLTSGIQNVTLKWKKVSGAAGYEIYMATSKNGKYKKVKTITKGKTLSYKQKQLLGKRTYYKIRAYTITNGKKIYSSYSKVKSVKVKGPQNLLLNIAYYENPDYSGPAPQILKFKSTDKLQITWRFWVGTTKYKWITDTYKYTIKGNRVTIKRDGYNTNIKISNNNKSFYYMY